MIRPDETQIDGQWMSDRGCTIRDAACDRIALLVQSWLTPLGTADGATFYEDPSDGRCWELSYPHRSMRGGGPPRLRAVPRDAVPALDLAVQKTPRA